MLPIDVLSLFGKFGGYSIFFLLGTGFGVALELAGFGDSRRLASQFYFKDMTVLKTMFTGIIVACILIFLSAGLGYLDFSQISVNETFLWPGIVGGLIAGVGFIIGGYCPGTSIISVASLKIDGLLFLVGTIIGAGFFGESLPAFDDFWYSSFTERYLIFDWLNWSVGATVFAVTLLAVVMFYGAEKAEEYFRIKGTGEKISWKITRKSYIFGAGTLLFMAALVWFIGQPDPIRKWEIMQNQYSHLLSKRSVFIHPLEYVKTNNEASIKLITLDFRSSEEFQKFHLKGSVNVKIDDVLDKEFVAPLARLPLQGVVVLISDKESESVKAWKYLKVQGVVNIYILENGLQDWNAIFANQTIPHKTFNLDSPPSEVLQLFPKNSYTQKIKIASKKRSGGLCS
jgi:rhodanese-related sulfurtransferase